MMKKIAICFALLAAVLSGCTITAPPETYPEIPGSIWWFSFAQADAHHYDDRTPQWLRVPVYAESDRLDDPQLQSAVADFSLNYPLDTEETVTAYAWELYHTCVELGYFDAVWEPCYISCYSDGIIDISFLDPQYINSYYDGYAPIVYVSALDGHIIEFTSNDA